MNSARSVKLLVCDRRATLGGPFRICLLAAVISAVLPALAAAQQSDQDSTEPVVANSSQAPAGRIIYSRDVSFGSAIGPRTPGRVQTVNAGPTDLIIGSLAIGLKPIGDDESANIIAGANSQTALIGNQIGLGLGALADTTGSGGTATTNLGHIQSSATGGAIGQATGAIRGAMDTLRGTLGGGQ